MSVEPGYEHAPQLRSMVTWSLCLSCVLMVIGWLAIASQRAALLNAAAEMWSGATGDSPAMPAPDGLEPPPAPDFPDGLEPPPVPDFPDGLEPPPVPNLPEMPELPELPELPNNEVMP